jgi:hemerythrin
MENKTVVQWHDSYSVGVKPIDEQHMELIRLTNKLFNSCMAGQNKTNKAFLDTVHEAVDYTRYHFGTEERMMERINYPHYANHKKEHIGFVREVLIKVEDFNTGKMLAPLEFVYFLRDWVLHHIAVCDKRLGDYLMALRESGDLQKIVLKVKKDKVAGRVMIK